MALLNEKEQRQEDLELRVRRYRADRFWTGFWAGLIVGISASALMLLLSVTLGGVSLPESFGAELTTLMPLPVFDFLHQFVGGDAKHYLFYCILIGQCLVFALSGGLYVLASERFVPSRTQPGRLALIDGLLLALLLWLFAGALLLPLTGGGLFGAQLSSGLLRGALSLAAVALVFGLLFVFVQNWLAVRRVESSDEEFVQRAQERRTFLRGGLATIGVGLLGVVAWRFITQGTGGATLPSTDVSSYKNKIVPPPVPNYGEIHQVDHLSPEITPNDQYYVVSKNLFSDPSVSAAGWQLKVEGEVDRPFTLSYADLTALPMQQQYESMMCISNEVGGQYMSNALWDGVRLKDLLERAGVKKGATKVVFRAVDDYSDSIHLSKALEPTTLLAVHMNGQPLPQGHGFPARMLVPGIYGMKHCKWITHIEVVNYDFQGYWQQRGWSDPASVRLTSRIDTPLPGITLPANSQTYVAGVAFSGNKGISEVDVSFDNGATWKRATLKKPLGALTWVLWEIPWQVPGKSGNHTITVRADDLQGNVQDPGEAPPLPDGSSGYHSIYITV